MKHLAILASGNGSNAEVIAQYLSKREDIKLSCILTNKSDAGVRERAERLGIPCYYFPTSEMKSGEKPLELLKKMEIDLVVLAGYLVLITPSWLETFPNRIINIHPALLPNYGGKGMYGHHVHEAVLKAGETTSGITIHLVDEHYDHGRHLLQATCPVLPEDTPETLAQRIHALEHRFFAPTIEHYMLSELP